MLTSTTSIFNKLAKGEGPKLCLLALGYAGWGPGQLEFEIKNNGWMNLHVESDFIFDEHVSKKWNDAYKLIGVNPSFLS